MDFDILRFSLCLHFCFCIKYIHLVILAISGGVDMAILCLPIIPPDMRVVIIIPLPLPQGTVSESLTARHEKDKAFG